MKRLGRLGVGGRETHRGLELAERVPPASLLEIDAAEVHERKLSWLVARRLLGALEPRDRLVELALLHQVHADVVVRVAEVGIHVDRAQALGRGLVEAPLKRVRPSQERVGLGRRTRRDRAPVDLDGALEIAGHLPTIRFAPELDRALALVHITGGLEMAPRPPTLGHAPAPPRRASISTRYVSPNYWGPRNGPQTPNPRTRPSTRRSAGARIRHARAIDGRDVGHVGR